MRNHLGLAAAFWSWRTRRTLNPWAWKRQCHEIKNGSKLLNALYQLFDAVKNTKKELQACSPLVGWDVSSHWQALPASHRWERLRESLGRWTWRLWLAEWGWGPPEHPPPPPVTLKGKNWPEWFQRLMLNHVKFLVQLAAVLYIMWFCVITSK